jgi:hypothetical protein
VGAIAPAGAIGVVGARGTAHALAGPDTGPARSAATVAEPAGPWSEPATLAACAGSEGPRAAFPSDSPTHATGRGAIVWNAASSCPGGGGTLVSVIEPGDVPGRATYARTAGGRRVGLGEQLGVTGGPHGQVVIGSSSAGTPAAGLLVEGPAGGPFTPQPSTGIASSTALVTGYLGDVAAGSVRAGSRDRSVLQVRTQRYFARSFFTRATVDTLGAGLVEDLTLALDYRTDALAVWCQNGAIHAMDLPARGPTRAPARLASTHPHPAIAALISDDNRAIVVWADQGAGETRLYVAISAPGVRFGAPRLLERFRDPPGAASPGSPRLVRLRNESVMLAWNSVQEGHWVVRVAAVNLSGVRPASTISPAGSEALLADLAAGPENEAIALWTTPQRSPAGGMEPARQAIYAARGFNAYPGATIFGQPEQVAPPGLNSGAAVVLDPETDRALALWRGPGGAIEYAIRAAGAPGAPAATAPPDRRSRAPQARARRASGSFRQG